MGFIGSLRDKGVLAPDQAALLEEIESRRLVSVSAELNGLLYLGALLIVAGVGASVKTYVDELGPLSILGGLAAAVLACAWYCLSRARPYENAQVPSPTAAFDYVLYLGCAFLGIAFGYAEAHFNLLDRFWDFYLLASAVLFLGLAYRFDNRLVLSMALINLGGFLGLRFSRWGLPEAGLELETLLYGLALIGAGHGLKQRGTKPHFEGTYLAFGCNAVLGALLWGVFRRGALSLEFPALAAAALAIGARAVRTRRFEYFLLATAYGYAGVSYLIVDRLRGVELVSLYFLASAGAVMAAIFWFRKSLEQDA